MPIPTKDRRESLWEKKIPAYKADEAHLGEQQKIKYGVL